MIRIILKIENLLAFLWLGAITYNIVHNYALGIGVVLIGLAFSSNALALTGLIFTAHVGMDRFLGFGLKYPDAFKHTHLGN